MNLAIMARAGNKFTVSKLNCTVLSVDKRNGFEHFAVTFIPATASTFHVHGQVDSSYSLQGATTGGHLLLKVKDRMQNFSMEMKEVITAVI
jgi:hypothetical protein